MSDWTVTKPNTNKEGVAEGRSRGERGAVCPSVFRCDCCSCIDRQNRFPPAPRARDLGFVLTSFLFFFFFSWMAKIWNNLNKKTDFENIYIFVFAFHSVSVNDVWICLIAFYLLCGGTGTGTGGWGGVLAACCLFSYLLGSSVCALGSFSFLVHRRENVASKMKKKNKVSFFFLVLIQNFVKKPKVKNQKWNFVDKQPNRTNQTNAQDVRVCRLTCVCMCVCVSMCWYKP